MPSFNISINEEQRQMITKALRNLPAHHVADPSELEVLTSMFSELKDDDDNYYVDAKDGKRKHMLHGFCL